MWEIKIQTYSALNRLNLESYVWLIYFKRAVGNKMVIGWLKKKIRIPSYEMIKLGKGLCLGDMIAIFLFEEFLHGSEIGLALQRPKLSP